MKSSLDDETNLCICGGGQGKDDGGELHNVQVLMMILKM